MLKKALEKKSLRFEQLENRALLSATTWDVPAEADAAVAAEMAATLNETAPIDLTAFSAAQSEAAAAANWNVATVDEFVNAVNEANDGDMIVIAPTLALIDTSLTISKNLSIVGSLDDNGFPATTIKGVAFDFSGSDAALDVSRLHFDSPAKQTFATADGAHVAVSECVFDGTFGESVFWLQGGTYESFGNVYQVEDATSAVFYISNGSSVLSMTNDLIDASTNHNTFINGVKKANVDMTFTHATIQLPENDMFCTGQYSGTLTLKNSIFAGDLNTKNMTVVAGADVLVVGTNNTDADVTIYDGGPLFVSVANRDFRLVEGSVAIDAGNNSFSVDYDGETLAVDLAVNFRQIGLCVDLGAYEFGSAHYVDFLDAPTISLNQLKLGQTDGTALNCKWDRVDGALHYRVEYREAGTDEWIFVDNCDLIGEDSQLVYDFTPGKTYEFRVRAECCCIASEWSETATITALTAPTFELAATDSVANTATFAFVAPENATKVRVEVSETPFASELPIPGSQLARVVTLSADAQEWTIRGLDPDATYYCRVYAINDAGITETKGASVSDWSELEFTLLTAPSDVVVTADAADATRGVVSWTNNETTATEFLVEISKDGSVWEYAATTTETSVELSGLTAGQDYYARVRSQLNGVVSTWAQGAFLNAPTDLSFAQTKLASADGSVIRVKWNDASALAEQYRVEYREAGATDWTYVATRGVGVQNQAIYDFAPGQTYEFRVRAENDYGVSDWATSTFAPLAAPTVEFAAVGETSFTLAFSAPEDATKMRVEILDAAFPTEAAISGANLTCAVTLNADVETWTYKNLDPTATYHVRVYAINAAGVSDWAEQELTLLAAPTDAVFAADAADATRGVVSWTNNAADATEFLLESSKDGKVWETVATTTETSVELSDMTAGEECYLRVRAQGENAVSVWSRGAILNAPTDLSFTQTKVASDEGSVVRVKWNDASALAEQYRVEYREAGATDWTYVATRGVGVQNQAIYDFAPGQTYEFRVRAENDYGVSDWATSTFASLAAPTVEVSAVDSTSFTLALSAPELATKMRVEVLDSAFSTEAAISSSKLTRCLTLSADAQTWTPKALTPGATYFVRVYAINAAGVSDWSEVLEITLPTTADDAVSQAFADVFAEEDGDDDFWFEFENATGARK